MQDRHDLKILLRSHLPLLVVETHEEQRVVELFASLAPSLGLPLFRWTVSIGLQRLDIDYEPQKNNADPRELFSQIKSTHSPGIYLLFDFHPFFDVPLNIRLIKDIALAYEHLGHTLVFVSHHLELPPELERFSARFGLSMPTREKLEGLVREEAQRLTGRNRGLRITADRLTLDRLIDNLTGLSLADARRLARGAIVDDGALTEADLPRVMQAKFNLLARDGVLSYEYDTARFAEVGGLQNLKEWLVLRAAIFSGRERPPGLDIPRGILLLGVQGCGKSLAAKAVAGTWGIPLLRMDFGTLYNKFFGETERNLREALKTAEVMAPCVLWIDEIEKAISVGSHDGGTSRRVLGTLLTWMAENTRRVFIVATANDIESLPPELLRKGRLDEIFFVDLPDAATRKLILGIHLRKRGLEPAGFDLDELADASDGFSGAEIEQAVVAGLYTAHARHGPLNGTLLLDEITHTRPLSVVMGERIAALRAWSRGRTVPAN